MTPEQERQFAKSVISPNSHTETCHAAHIRDVEIVVLTRFGNHDELHVGQVAQPLRELLGVANCRYAVQLDHRDLLDEGMNRRDEMCGPGSELEPDPLGRCCPVAQGDRRSETGEIDRRESCSLTGVLARCLLVGGNWFASGRRVVVHDAVVRFLGESGRPHRCAHQLAFPLARSWSKPIGVVNASSAVSTPLSAIFRHRKDSRAMNARRVQTRTRGHPRCSLGCFDGREVAPSPGGKTPPGGDGRRIAPMCWGNLSPKVRQRKCGVTPRLRTSRRRPGRTRCLAMRRSGPMVHHDPPPTRS